MPRGITTISYENAISSSSDDDPDDDDLEDTSEITSFNSVASHHRPILVGYAFGPKKMSTMGLIMAEASQALSTVMSSAVLEDEELFVTHTPQVAMTTEHGGVKEGEYYDGGDEPSLPSLVTCSTRSSLTTHSKKTTEGERAPSPSSSSLVHNICNLSQKRLRQWQRHHHYPPPSSTHYHTSSLSSNASQSSSIISGLEPSYIAYDKDAAMMMSGGVRNKRGGMQLQPIRVSFVPLDLDAPLEEQHGGQFDVILHKLTEDILCLSSPGGTTTSLTSTSTTIDNNTHRRKAAAERLSRLTHYKTTHPSCCLVDHPKDIATLISRRSIAHRLEHALVGVTTTAGVPVRAPRYIVLDKPSCSSTLSQMTLRQISFPVIAKPLTAAGTVTSHRMVVILSRDGLTRATTPCLVQEYANHDGVLYKVYVLGETVWVFPRVSLPNLPQGERDYYPGFVEFDSQRPYPKLSDFGLGSLVESSSRSCEGANVSNNVKKIKNEGHDSKRQRITNNPSDKPQPPLRINYNNNTTSVTADEIQPVVSVLSEAFGLGLFGFDILVSTSHDGKKEMLVVDVNYFPSYKEVPNFPSLLAQYLTRLAIRGRTMTVQEDNKREENHEGMEEEDKGDTGEDNIQQGSDCRKGVMPSLII